MEKVGVDMEIQEYEKMKKQVEIYESATRILNLIDTYKREINNYQQYKKEVFEIEISQSNNKNNIVPHQKIYFTGETKDKIIDVIIDSYEEEIERLKKNFENIKYEV